MQLGASSLCRIQYGDKSNEMEVSFAKWSKYLISGYIRKYITLTPPSTPSPSSPSPSPLPLIQDTLPFDPIDDGIVYSESDEEEEEDEPTLDLKQIGTTNPMTTSSMDLEDMGKVAGQITAAKLNRQDENFAFESSMSMASREIGNNSVKDKPVREAKEMLTPMLRAALTKQGYKLIGSHSGVKICRWTKAMLRGRGGCYKHTFYGIASHRCLESE